MSDLLLSKSLANLLSFQQLTPTASIFMEV